MKVITESDPIPPLTSPIALTIGVYDSVHIGHQAIIKQLHKKTKAKGSRCILTFTTHPSTLLMPEKSESLIISLEHRLHLFAYYGIDFVFLFSFTPKFQKQPYDVFLSAIREKIPFSHLVLGENASFGEGQKGTPSRILAISKILGFEAHYMKKEEYKKEEVSSTAIRKAIALRDLKKIKKMLKRPYSLWAPYDLAAIKRENETLYKWSLFCPNICSLPTGIYAVDLERGNSAFPAIAFVQKKSPILQQNGFSLQLFFYECPPPSSHLNIVFIDYLHEGPLTQSPEEMPTFVKQMLSPQPT